MVVGIDSSLWNDVLKMARHFISLLTQFSPLEVFNLISFFPRYQSRLNSSIQTAIIVKSVIKTL